MTAPSQKLWFKRRRYGYGWTPVTWQGWLCLVVFALYLIGAAYLTFPRRYTSSTELTPLILYLLQVVSATLILVGICFMKGPMPRWRWGKKPIDDPHQDF